MPYSSKAQSRFMHRNHPDIAARWDKEYPSQKGLPMHVKKKVKAKLSVNNKMKSAFGKTTFKDGKVEKIEINKKAHKGDKAELASTIKHELMHVEHPKMTEKDVYKKTAKTKISEAEQDKLLAKLRDKKINYKVGAMKRMTGVKMKEFKPGDLISKVNESKSQIINSSKPQLPAKTRLSIMGLV